MRRKKKLSKEHRARISASLKARWAGGAAPPPAPEPVERKERFNPPRLVHGHPAPREGRRF